MDGHGWAEVCTYSWVVILDVPGGKGLFITEGCVLLYTHSQRLCDWSLLHSYSFCHYRLAHNGCELGFQLALLPLVATPSLMLDIGFASWRKLHLNNTIEFLAATRLLRTRVPHIPLPIPCVIPHLTFFRSQVAQRRR